MRSSSRSHPPAMLIAVGTPAPDSIEWRRSTIGSLSAPLARRRGRLPLPSIWPLINRRSFPSPSTEKIWNLTLEEPALTTRIVSMAITRQHLEHAGALHAHRVPPPHRKPSVRAPSPHATSERRAPGRRARCRHHLLRRNRRDASPAYCQPRGRERAVSVPGRRPWIRFP